MKLKAKYMKITRDRDIYKLASDRTGVDLAGRRFPSSTQSKLPNKTALLVASILNIESDFLLNNFLDAMFKVINSK